MKHAITELKIKLNITQNKRAEYKERGVIPAEDDLDEKIADFQDAIAALEMYSVFDEPLPERTCTDGEACESCS